MPEPRRWWNSLRLRLTVGVSVLIAVLGLGMLVYIANVPYWAVTLHSPQPQTQVFIAPGGTSVSPPPANEPAAGIVVPGVSLREQANFWRYGLLGVAVMVAVGALAAYILVGYLLRSLESLRRTVSALSPDALPLRLPTFGREQEVQELTAAYNRFLRKVHHLLDAQRRFAADAAHELRSPLSTLRMQFGVLRHPESLTPAERQQTLSDMEAVLDGMVQTVESLLLLAQEPTPATWQDVRLADLVRTVLADVRPLAQSKGVALEADLAPEVVVRGEPRWLAVVVRNLLENAVRYNSAGGQVHVRLTAQGGQAVLQVSDTGWGIPEEEQPFIFQRFFRGEQARRVEGNGLGLALVEALVRHHGGRVSVQSTVGKGSVFTVSLPLQAAGV